MRFDSIDKLINALTLQSENLPTYAAAIGATPAEITAVDEALAVLVYIVNYSDLYEANKKTVTQIKQAVYNGEVGEPVAAIPVMPAGAPPFAMIAGLLTLALERHRRWKAAAGYTEEAGIALGIAGATLPPDPATVKPTIEVSAAQRKACSRSSSQIAANPICGTCLFCQKAPLTGPPQKAPQVNQPTLTSRQTPRATRSRSRSACS